MLSIDGLAQGGRGVGRANGVVVFVPLTAPGDRVRARITRTHRRHCEGELVEVMTPSPEREKPPCTHFGKCGGCSWQHMSYSAQLRAKEDLLRESLERLGGLPKGLPYHPIVPSEDAHGYRNKMEFSFDQNGVLGLHRRGRFDEVLELEGCLLPSQRAMDLALTVKRLVRERALPSWDRRRRTGLLRHLVIREGRGTGEMMAGLVTTSDPFPNAERLAGELAERHEGLESVVRAVTDSPADAVAAERLEVLHGRDHIMEKLGGILFRVELETFFQTNTAQAEKLVDLVIETAELTGDETAIDIFCGVGTFSLLLARRAARVFGLEVVPNAVDSARRTAEREGFRNVSFMAADARRGLPVLLEKAGAPPDLILLDPPRSGTGGKVMRRIGRAAPGRVIYVSCNPTTLAPDLAWLIPFGYEVTSVQPLDMFPQTHHLETIVRLDRKPEADNLEDPFRT